MVQADVMFGLFNFHFGGKGGVRTVAINSAGVVVELHTGPLRSPLITVGQMECIHYRLNKTFAVEISMLDESTPTVTLNDQNFLMVAYKTRNDLKILTSQLDPYALTFSLTTTLAMGSGHSPKLAKLGGQLALLVHLNAGHLLVYSIAHEWGKQFSEPRAINNTCNCLIRAFEMSANNLGHVIVVLNSLDGLHWTITGKFHGSDGSIHWSPASELGMEFSSILQPQFSVALNDDNKILLILQKATEPDYITLFGYLRLRPTGHRLFPFQIIWISHRIFHYANFGSNPSVAMNNWAAIYVDEASFSTSLVRDRFNWMSSHLNRTLLQMTIAGSHDAGAYKLKWERVDTGCKKVPAIVPHAISLRYAKTQSEDIFKQLKDGVRYFDLRPYYWPEVNDFYIQHEHIGPKISDILNQVKSFASSARSELIILQFSHFCTASFNGTEKHRSLANLINTTLWQHMFRVDLSNCHFLECTLAELLGHGHHTKVLVVYAHHFTLNHPHYGFMERLPVYDKYANTDELQEMQLDQRKKIWAHLRERSFELFLLSYTLTFQASTIFLSKGEDLWTLTKNASRTLTDYVGNLKKIGNFNQSAMINIILVDYVQETRVADVSFCKTNANLIA